MLRTLLRRLLRAAWVAPHVLRAFADVILTQTVEHTIPRRSLRIVGPRTYIPPDVSFRFSENIELGSGISLGPGDRLWASPSARIIIGDHAMLGPDVTILTANHTFDDRDTLIFDQPERERDVNVGSDVWIGTNAVILPGVTIGKGAVVAAGAVVNTDVNAFTIVGGVPARQIGTRGSSREL